MLQVTYAEPQSKIYLADGINFFQGFNGYSCYWNYYSETLEWARINHDKDPVKCAKLCAEHERCTGFELSYSDNDPYCAFWYGGACGHEEMRAFVPYYFGSQVPTVATYVLMDGNARFYKLKCDYKALNMSAGVTISNVHDPSESKCTNICNDQSNCTGSVAPINNKKFKSNQWTSHSTCKLLSDPSCKTPNQKSRYEVTTIRHPLSAEASPFTDAYGLCNPFSEVLRGYSTCADYAGAFPCDCEKKLGNICTDTNVSSTQGAVHYAWTGHQGSACKGERLSTTPGPASSCKLACEADSNCGCFEVTSDECVLHASTNVTKDKDGQFFDKVFSLARISYDPEATLADICPTDCNKASRERYCHAYPDPGWYSPSFLFLLILTPIMFVAVLTMAIWTYVQRRCFPNRGAPAPVPAMKKKDINAMGTEKFTSESELKYGQIECSICIVPFEVGDVMRVMKCGHRFHKDCVDEWLSRYKAVCPLCKVDMRADAEPEETEETEREAEGATDGDTEGATDGDVEMGDFARESESSTAQTLSTAQTPEPDHDDESECALQQETEAQQLSEPLLENEDERTHMIENDSLANTDVTL